ncbi:hypothetical protein J5Y04_22540 [Kitasatospora sp. RG8]|uniref:hypothetical protein n=1 Tax=Kitasatospora sp. RG8 TaxID=2820815 RepID=UPI001AE05CD9|nr:hypothetical protein [Kitasatospora sp. RG8]MBP0452298.1 hypothetical protein [Kitasatospora sp. RG8]
MSEDWAEAAVELNAGYTVVDADGTAVSSVPRARVALQGGFAKLRLPGTATVQVVSAPAVRLITFPA